MQVANHSLGRASSSGGKWGGICCAKLLFTVQSKEWTYVEDNYKKKEDGGHSEPQLG